MEVGSGFGPLMQEISAVKKPISLVDDATKIFDSSKGVGNQGYAGLKTTKNLVGYLKEQGGDVSVPNLKRVRIKALPKNWKSQ